ncbi:MAG: hydroxyacylglutathione hydrolase [Gammaproteobacteria bacterium]|nr:hydroxyacylglutathione hydrolase [Gammaproteobacteria bacterium]
MLKIDAIPAFNDNYIWFIHAPDTQHVLIVDPGDAVPVFDAIKQHDLIPIAILITHGCHDHVDGIGDLLEQYDLPVYGPENEFIPHITHPLSACDELSISPHFPAFRVLDLPGHTKGHIGFLMEGCLFCGDTLFGAGCGRLHGNPAELLFRSLQQVVELPSETLIYCAHEYTEANLRFAVEIEPKNEAIRQRIVDTALMRKQGEVSLPSTLALERQTNPFLRCGQSDVNKAAERWSAQQLDSQQAVFTELRKWKDSF